jgi:NAD(P)-dependent dehydrogenase (short-subunit alcohol dehydrogenase family)
MPMSARSSRWTARDLPNLRERIVVVTGANSGIGFEASLALAGAGAHVVLGCRNEALGSEALAAIRETHPSASLELVRLDLAELDSVRRFADLVAERHSRLDVLVNNAGVMALPHRRTADGFEMQLGTNHLGHFALTGHLLGRLLATEGSRVVTVSSLAHNFGAIRFDDLHGERSYHPWLAYGQAKLANLLFAYELQRRLTAARRAPVSVACHPGYANTNLQMGAARIQNARIRERLWQLVNGTVAQSTAMGALPTLYAAVSPDVEGGDYIGPGGLFELFGHPMKVTSNRRSRDPVLAARLWRESETLTGVSYGALLRVEAS